MYELAGVAEMKERTPIGMVKGKKECVDKLRKKKEIREKCPGKKGVGSESEDRDKREPRSPRVAKKNRGSAKAWKNQIRPSIDRKEKCRDKKGNIIIIGLRSGESTLKKKPKRISRQGGERSLFSKRRRRGGEISSRGAIKKGGGESSGKYKKKSSEKKKESLVLKARTKGREN